MSNEQEYFADCGRAVCQLLQFEARDGESGVQCLLRIIQELEQLRGNKVVTKFAETVLYAAFVVWWSSHHIDSLASLLMLLGNPIY
jgi:hypothetical protein